MGACGCSGNGSFFKLPAPDGGVYVLQLQPPCADCPGPAGIAVHRYSKTRLDEAPDFAEDAEAIELHDLGHGYAETGLSVLDIVAARARVTKWLVDEGMAWDESEGEEHARDLLDECVVPLLFEQPEGKAGG